MCVSVVNFQAKTGIMVGILDIGFFATAIVVSQLVLDGETRIGALGFVCAGLNIIMYGSPLSVMVRSCCNFKPSVCPFTERSNKLQLSWLCYCFEFWTLYFLPYLKHRIIRNLRTKFHPLPRQKIQKTNLRTKIESRLGGRKIKQWLINTVVDMCN